MLAPPQLAATLNKRGGGPNYSSSHHQHYHHNSLNHKHHLHLTLSRSQQDITNGEYQTQYHHQQHNKNFRHFQEQQVQLPQQLLPHHSCRSIEPQLSDLGNYNNNIDNNIINNIHNNRHSYSLIESTDLNTLINYNHIVSGLKTLKVDNPKEFPGAQNPQAGPTSGSGGGNGGTSAGSSYQQSFYWLNKDPSSGMLMDKSKQKRK